MEYEKVLERVQKLLAKAEGTEYEEERAIFVKKADDLMTKYMVEQWEVDQFSRAISKQRKPELREFRFDTSNEWEVRNALANMFAATARFCRCELGPIWTSSGKVVGYPADLNYLEMLFISLQVQMASALTPHWDPTLSEGENIHNLKMAGMKWQDIYYIQHPEGTWERRHGVRYTNVYKKWAEQTGTERQQTSGVKEYREQFIRAYTRRIKERLQKIDQVREEETAGYSLVRVSIADDLKEALYQHFPSQRPHPEECECDICHRRKCHDFNCQRPICVEARKPLPKSHFREVLVHDRARQAGRRSADKADFGLSGVKKGGPSGELG